MTDLTREDTPQPSLFMDESREKARKLEKVHNAIKSKLGASVNIHGSSVQSKTDIAKKYSSQLEQKETEHRKS